MSELESILSFNRQFVDSGEYEKFFTDKYPERGLAILSCMDARMMEWLMAHAGGFSFETAATELLSYQRKVGPTELIPLLGTAKAFREHIPKVVYSLYPK